MKQEMKKDETKKEAMHKEMGEMKVGSCSPECGFMVRSHNESEVMEMLKTHAKKQHNMNMSDKDAMAKIKPAGHMERGEMKKEETKEMKKESK
jgi:predicted small metal-binding protein